MSQLRLYNTNWGTRYLNVLSFSSPVTGMIDSAQTRTMIHHFPIKALQPELEVEVIFRNEREYEDFQLWVRNVQIDSQINDAAPGVTLWWPQRSIYNWTGVIKAFRAGGTRFNFSPRAKFTFDLIDSMVSSRTTLSSWAAGVESIYGNDTNLSDALLTPPSPVDTSPVSETPEPMPTGPIIPSAPSVLDNRGGGGQGGGGGGGGTW